MRAGIRKTYSDQHYTLFPAVAWVRRSSHTATPVCVVPCTVPAHSHGPVTPPANPEPSISPKEAPSPSAISSQPRPPSLVPGSPLPIPWTCHTRGLTPPPCPSVSGSLPARRGSGPSRAAPACGPGMLPRVVLVRLSLGGIRAVPRHEPGTCAGVRVDACVLALLGGFGLCFLWQLQQGPAGPAAPGRLGVPEASGGGGGYRRPAEAALRGTQTLSSAHVLAGVLCVILSSFCTDTGHADQGLPHDLILTRSPL